MNYNSIEEIFAAGTTNMEVLRNGSKQDDGTDVITGVSWFTYNGTVASTIYVNGNSWIGFGSSSEHLKVNNRDGAMLYLYREEGTLYNYFKFLKIRWRGYSRYNYTTADYKVEYDVILWDTGDISLHMISIPTSYNSGTYSLDASSTYTYTVSTSSPDVTFMKTDSGFEVNNSIINLEIPFEKRYLVRDGSNYYTIASGTLSSISISELTSEVFLTNGVKEIPTISLLSGLSNPEILYWADDTEGAIQELSITGIPPLPQIVYYEAQNNLTICKIETVASDDALFTITFDGGQTWKYYHNNTWNTSSTDSEGMTTTELKNISSESWAELGDYTSYQFRCVLPSVDSYTHGMYVRHN